MQTCVVIFIFFKFNTNPILTDVTDSGEIAQSKMFPPLDIIKYA